LFVGIGEHSTTSFSEPIQDHMTSYGKSGSIPQKLYKK